MTKSRFTLAMDCPTKLFYTGKSDYVNNSLQDPFLEALAKGGFQVGELAINYYPGGTDIETLDYEQSLQETNALLKQENCIIYEAAIKFENLFIRVDILEKTGNQIKLMEVKAKSTDSPTDEVFYKKDGDFQAEWKQYVYDVAFQTYVVENAFPEYEVIPYLMLVDKTAASPTDGLNQKFKIRKDENGRKSVILTENLSEADLAQELLVRVNMERTYEKIRYEDTFPYLNQEVSFPTLINNYASMYERDERIEPIISSVCKSCEFKADEEQLKAGLKSGYHECFKTALNWDDQDFAEDSIFKLWDYRRTDKMLQEGNIKLADLTKDDIGFKESDQPGLSRTERQWMQIKKSVNKDRSYYIDKINLKNEMNKWTFPLHFIDFETASPAIPFNQGRKPYEGIAFQFSHHMVHEDGSVEHKNEYLNTEPGVNPNYAFIRELKSALENDQGSIFRYSSHENTYLNKIYEQLQTDETPVIDRDELSAFIREITEYKIGKEKVEGPRNMVDLFKLVKSYYYDPAMEGSNSIKAVLPAVLNSSTYLQEKYAKPIYGAVNGVASLNFKDWTWIQWEDGKVVDPYQLLPKLFEDIAQEEYEHLDLDENMNDGGAAMTAYERLQFGDVSEEVRKEVEKALLKYCELDTLAMVMIYEAWVDMVK